MVGLFSFPPLTPLLLLLLISITRSSSGVIVLFSNLPQTLLVSVPVKEGEVLRAGEDKLVVSLGLNKSSPMAQKNDHGYERVKLTLCYAPSSQAGRDWRNTDDNLSKDKTCQFVVAVRPYSEVIKNSSFTCIIGRDVPSATYFVRAYALDSGGVAVAYGQSTDAGKSANLFDIAGISGRKPFIDIAAWSFSAFSVVALFLFVMVEKKKVRK